MAQFAYTLRRWKRLEYERLVELGAFEGDPLELISGQLIVAEPKGTYHTSAVTSCEYALRAVLPPGWLVRTQAPISLDEDSAPEPDIVVVAGRLGDFRYAHPARPPLVIEVADSSLAFDRHDKGSLYARAGLQDYWIINLVDRLLEIYRDPVADPGALYGWRYRSLVSLGATDVVRPLALPSVQLAVVDLLP
jgi:Uma2 family endonuclease